MRFCGLDSAIMGVETAEQRSIYSGRRCRDFFGGTGGSRPEAEVATTGVLGVYTRHSVVEAVYNEWNNKSAKRFSSR